MSVELIYLEPREVFDGMVLGVLGGSVVYDSDAIIEYWEGVFLGGGVMDEEEAYNDAVDWFEFNVRSAYVGEGTPVYLPRSSLAELDCDGDWWGEGD